MAPQKSTSRNRWFKNIILATSPWPHDLDRQVAGRSKLLQTIVASLQTSDMSYSASLVKACDCGCQHFWDFNTVSFNICRYENVKMLDSKANSSNFLLPCSLTSLSFKRCMSTGGVKAFIIPRSDVGTFEIMFFFCSLEYIMLVIKSTCPPDFQRILCLYHPSISTEPWRIYLLKTHKHESFEWLSSAFLINQWHISCLRLKDTKHYTMSQGHTITYHRDDSKHATEGLMLCNWNQRNDVKPPVPRCRRALNHQHHGRTGMKNALSLELFCQVACMSQCCQICNQIIQVI